MPYIKQEDRRYIKLNGNPQTAGELNYAIHILLETYMKVHPGSYQTYNDIIGVLECVKQEVYRRKIAPYEQLKIEESGDIEFYESK